MSADLLREAADEMRETAAHKYLDRLIDDTERKTWFAVACWLDAAATRAETKTAHGGNEVAVWSHEQHALAVATAYLGRTS